MTEGQKQIEVTIAKIRNEQTRVRCVLHILRKRKLQLSSECSCENRILISAVPVSIHRGISSDVNQ